MLSIGLSLTAILRSSVAVVDYSPASLFSLSEPGLWLDPSDLTTLFQDTAGTTPVTTPGQTVALALDKSKGLVLGSELVTNGDFSSGTTGWTTPTAPTATFTATGGIATLTLAANDIFGGIRQAVTTVSGVRYKITASVRTSGKRIGVAQSGGTGYPTTTSASFVTLNYQFVASGTSTNIDIFFDGTGASGDSFFVDNISVKELPGFHATQATTASRPIYGINPVGGRRNALVWTEQFDNAAWVRQNISAFGSGSVANTTATTDPIGLNTADFIQETTANNIHWVEQLITTTAQSYTFSCYMKAATRSWGYLRIRLFGGVDRNAFFNLSNGTVGTVSSGLTASTPVSVGNGWYRCEVTTTAAIAGANPVAVGVTNADNTVIYTGDGSSGIYIWGAQLETGSTATAYQKVTTQYDVTEAGVASVSYLAFDGVDDFLVTPTITPGIDKAQVFAGVRKLTNHVGLIVEASTVWDTNAGACILATVTTNQYTSGSRGNATYSVSQGTNSGQFTADHTSVLSSTHDIPGDLTTLRVNSVAQSNSTADKGAGNFLAYPLYIGRRGGTTLPFNGNLYSLIVRFGTNLDAGTITSTETWVNGKTGAY